jgi:hypothetical protein
MNWNIRVLSSLMCVCAMSVLPGCGGGEGGDPSITTSATPMGAVVTLAWDPVQDPTVYAYRVHYGIQSAGQPGVCSYTDSVSVSSPAATINGLDPDSRYYFAVSAYNGMSGPCSNEVSTVTPPSQS